MTPAAPRFLSAATSEQGFVRPNNEDRVYSDDALGVFLVVDGMGGHNAGEKAAELAVDHIRRRLERQTGSVEQRVREAIALANNAIYEAAQENPEWKGMACVLTLAVIQDGAVTIGHVGDSRLYRIKPGQIEKITHDHSPIGEREDRGELSETEAMAHPGRNEVFRDVGSQPQTPDEAGFIELTTIPFERASAILLCSDGLSDALPAAEILATVEQHAGDRWTTVRALAAAASRRGHDNVSAVLVQGDEFAKTSQVAASPRPAAIDVSSEDTARMRAAVSETPWYLHGGVWLAAGLLLGAAAGFLYERLGNQERQSGTVQVWTVTAPETIGAALAKAHPGDTVAVAPGLYRESVRLLNGVSILAQSPHDAVIEGDITAEGVSNSRVEGFGIRGAVRVINGDVTLVRDEVSGSAQAGIEFRGNSRGAVVGSVVRNNAGTGILVADAATPLIEHNSILANGFSDPKRPGILVQGEAHPRVQYNIFGGNGAESIWTRESDEALMLNNFFNSAPSDRRPKVRVVRTGEDVHAPR